MVTQTKIQDLEQKIEMLTARLNALGSNATIPLEVGEAFRKRLMVVSGDSDSTVPKTVTVSGYVVSDKMTGFITITINGNARLVPYY